jgi:hypothetical protein
MAESIAIVNGTFVGSEERNGRTSLVLNLPSFNSNYDTKASFVEDNPHGLTANQAYTFKLRRDRPQPKYANDDPETLPQWAYYYTYMGLSSEAPPEAPESASEPRKAGAPQQPTRAEIEGLRIWRSVALQQATKHVGDLLVAGEELMNSTVSILGVADAFYGWLANEEEPSPTEEKPKAKAKPTAEKETLLEISKGEAANETPEEPPLDEEMVERNEAESRDVEEQGTL